MRLLVKLNQVMLGMDLFQYAMETEELMVLSVFIVQMLEVIQESTREPHLLQLDHHYPQVLLRNNFLYVMVPTVSTVLTVLILETTQENLKELHMHQQVHQS